MQGNGPQAADGQGRATALGPGPRTAVRRKADRARYDRAAVHAVLDEGLVCHVAFRDGDQPVVLPMAYARVGDTVLLHGAAGNHLLRSIDGAPVCVAVTLVDALILARSAFHHSLDYRSVVVFGRAALVEDPAAKERALAAVVDHLASGRSADARKPTETELRATRVVAVPIEEASVKARAGGVADEPADLALPVWAGTVPVPLVPGRAVADGAGVAVPAPPYVSPYRRPVAS